MSTTLIALALLSQASIQLDRNTEGASIIRVIDGAEGNVAIYVAEQTDVNLPAALGATTKSGGDLLFTPRFPFQPGREYRVEFNGGEKLIKIVRMPEGIKNQTGLLKQIYPSASALPANQLKLYLQFSAPMSRGVAYQHIRLFDEKGREIEHAFLELGEELWDSSQTRFTLLFDPGRIKRDLVPNVDDGAPLQSGHRYTVKVDREWPDGHGSPIGVDASKEFAVVAADRNSPDPNTWQLIAPQVITLDPVSLNFPEAMDYGVLLHALRVVDANGETIAGSISVDSEEKRWRFSPDKPWAAGSYQLKIDGTLEDLAGNRIGRLFEVDTRAAPDMASRPSGKSTALPFSIAASGKR